MNKIDTLKKIEELGLLAVIRGPSPDLTMKMVAALIAGGVHGIEITYSTPSAASVVRSLSEKYDGEILLGMGTLTSPRQVEEARDAGAKFIVSPHYDEALGRAMVQSGLVAMIGALTPSEVFHAHRLGTDVVKIFPGSLVGPGYITALHGPFPEIRMMPSGGVDVENILDWFSAGAFAVGAGSNLCPGAWAKEGRFPEITDRALQFTSAVKQARERTISLL
jgi:2-dehydro-3-deoxyphosphogluconate aldolase/(4S)-4-hydroxy-2-oxoglutarate aldolase